METPKFLERIATPKARMSKPALLIAGIAMAIAGCSKSNASSEDDWKDDEYCHALTVVADREFGLKGERKHPESFEEQRGRHTPAENCEIAEAMRETIRKLSCHCGWEGEAGCMQNALAERADKLCPDPLTKQE